jgi:hypothetical protein
MGLVAWLCDLIDLSDGGWTCPTRQKKLHLNIICKFEHFAIIIDCFIVSLFIVWCTYYLNKSMDNFMSWVLLFLFPFWGIYNLNWIRPSFQTYPKKCYLSNCLSSLIQNSHSPRCTFNPSSSVAPSLSRSFYNPWTRTINMYPGPALGGSNTTAFHNNRLSSPRPARPWSALPSRHPFVLIPAPPPMYVTQQRWHSRSCPHLRSGSPTNPIIPSSIVVGNGSNFIARSPANCPLECFASSVLTV